ncbi:hypothetical protein B4113_2226 [Geobacillus sp. B4113_201601]|nr:hypothetical protein B4113_2226 [Geobacillus sp. B4113_201601]
MRYGNAGAAVCQHAALGVTPLDVFVQGAKRCTRQPKRESGSGLENVRESHDK